MGDPSGPPHVNSAGFCSGCVIFDPSERAFVTPTASIIFLIFAGAGHFSSGSSRTYISCAVPFAPR